MPIHFGSSESRPTRPNYSINKASGSDLLWRGDGRDTFIGCAGPDTLIGGQGYDLLGCGVRVDAFAFHTGNGGNRVT
jgi:Ca2+-binding RTX toxin-like protein